ncbi:helix-turn-helix domain-containing protein [Chromobacterium aquaticum]|uniref:Helix-turn-helix domain-containing protein n=1 Tax=Chromobacterium aquaticum TaxID=467180 RepID=A0ABV9A0T0_9NEIS|nr:helix-turn-helix transcriptional regulator [Chromobacterium aquaticum]MCD5363606.1 helix-turn-helix domain-containing protein [Chromobacterium aquaticum]
MKTFQDYVEEIKQKQGLTSNYAVAKLLLIDVNKMSDIMKGRRNPPAITRYTIADILGYDKTEVSACLDYWETKDPDAREYIKAVFLRHSRHVAALFLALTMLGGASDSNASTAGKHAKRLDGVSHYAKHW